MLEAIFAFKLTTFRFNSSQYLFLKYTEVGTVLCKQFRQALVSFAESPLHFTCHTIEWLQFYHSG